jgi:UDP-N-acetylmuramoylalanine--D-glutamate ligase
MGELELAWRLLPNPFVAVTGTNGKTTTVELLGHIHRTAGIPVAVAGNVGTALAGLVGDLAPDVVIVAETSSFQLEDALFFTPETAALLNITADHLDRHGTLAAYRDAKLRVFQGQGAGDVAVVPAGLGPVPGTAERVTFGAGGDVTEQGGELRWRGQALMPVSDVRLRGPHNLLNAMAAAAVALSRGIDPAAVRDALATFAGVPHRLEEVASIAGVLFVNDSKATNVDSTIVALRSFSSGVRLILGGRGKGQDFTALRDLVRERCASVHLVGEDADGIADALAGVDAHQDGDLDRAVEHAAHLAQPGDVVLLSPACASWDQFRDFEERGDRFRALARRNDT